MKKLIPALCMLLVAACLMGTSTYAWFAANTQVSASGMEVKALSSGGLAIASYTNNSGAKTPPIADNFKSAYTLNFDATKGLVDYVQGADAIKPVSYNNDKAAAKWFTAAAANADDGKAAEGLTEVTSDPNAYRKAFYYQVKSLRDGYTSEVYVSDVTVDGVSTSAVLDKSLRVAIVTAEASFIFAPVHVAQQENEKDLVYATGIEDGAFTTGKTNLLRLTSYDADETVIFAALGTAAQDVTVYVYYEGEDPNCKSANATNIDTLKVTFKLNVAGETQIVAAG